MAMFGCIIPKSHNFLNIFGLILIAIIFPWHNRLLKVRPTYLRNAFDVILALLRGVLVFRLELCYHLS
jgi:hypothetical protein